MTDQSCDYCGASFDDRASYDRHLRDTHDDELDDEQRQQVYGKPLRRPSRRQLLAVGGVFSLGLAAGTYDRLLASEAEAVNEFGYDTLRQNGVDVPLVPVDDAIDWHDDSDTLFVDARGRTQYETSRIAGSVLSPAPDGQDQGDPIADISQDTRIVTYCGCPHHLSTLRGAALIQSGYTNTYAIDEGFFAWQDAGYPLEGEDAEETPRLHRIEGQTDPAHAGAFAWARHDPSGQREPAPIQDDGRFAINVRFYEIDPSTPLQLSVPDADVTKPVGDLSEGTVRL